MEVISRERAWRPAHPASCKRTMAGFSQPDQRAPMPSPTSQVTLLFTDIEGSTALWEEDEARMSQALALHDALARNTVESHGGAMVKMTGDGFLAWPLVGSVI